MRRFRPGSRIKVVTVAVLLMCMASLSWADEFSTLRVRLDSLMEKAIDELNAAIVTDPALADLAHFGAALPALRSTENTILSQLETTLSPGQRNSFNVFISSTGLIQMADSTLAGTDVAIILRVIKKLNAAIQRFIEGSKIASFFIGGPVIKFLETKNDILGNIIEVKENKEKK